MFVPGQLVVCIDDQPLPFSAYPHNGDMGGLSKGRIYTIREAGLVTKLGAPGVLVAEVVRKRRNPETPFASRRFRPVSAVASKLFASLLEPTKTRQPHGTT